MIDLHCHLLPGIDDGAPDLAESLAMARVAVADGITIIACTPHIYPGLYDNTGAAIRQAVAQLARALDDADIGLQLIAGADVHLAPDLIEGLESGRVLSLADTRYFLLEPPHNVAPPRLEQTMFRLLAAGYVPIVTHPERLSWIESQFALFQRLVAGGIWMQITADSLTGRFGKRARYWSERMLQEGMVHVLCTDAHSSRDRAPRLSAGRDMAARLVGEDEAERLVTTRPLGVLNNLLPSEIASPAGARLSAYGC